jgi:uncharacterized lipoprotein YddW (UPF0748 family)
MKARASRPGAVRTLAGIVFLVWVAAGGALSAEYEPFSVVPPKPDREFRGVWVATVGNLDWPSKPGLSTTQQKAELVSMLDRAAQLRLNAVLFQVRPCCDALYASRIEPWSEYLTGTMGRRPEPFYDPLEFVVEEAHRRGLELHAWFNPFRARHTSAKSAPSSDHVSCSHPQLVRSYGPLLWLDPGEKAAQAYTLSVVLDVVRRYDIDGVHFDDYFYPYKERDASGKELDFPDEASWRRFGKKTELSRDDWRRENINLFIRRTYKEIKAAKPWVKFGVSPFGIWRPGHPPRVEGLDAYASIYADSRAWLANGWLDYLAPQLYWAIDAPKQSFPSLLEWWVQQNPRQRLIVAGMNSIKARHEWPLGEIINQIQYTRRQPGSGGQVHWDMKTLMLDSKLAGALQREVYAKPALVPAMPWLGRPDLGRPTLAARPRPNGAGLQITWSAAAQDKPAWWLLQTRTGEQWNTEILPGRTRVAVWTAREPEVIALSAVNRAGGVSPARAVRTRALSGGS